MNLIDMKPVPKKWYEWIPLFGKWLYRKRTAVQPFTKFVMPVIRNPGGQVSIDEIFSGPSLSDSTDSVFEFEVIHLNWFQRKIRDIKFWWDKRRGRIIDGCWR